MERMLQEGNRLVCRWDGETLIVEPWGENGLRVISAMLREPEDTDYALLPQERVEAVITVGEERSEIRNGKIIGVLEKGKNSGAVLSFYNSEGKLLLAEAGEGGALNRRSRFFKPVIGGDYQLAVTFASDPEEKLYGMGQYQQDFLNIKNCNLELAQRNSQASVPFLLSSLGYGFLWHNPAVGRVSFGANTTEWFAQSTKQLDYWITAGDTPDEIEHAFSAVTGRVPMMPEYGLGFWQCKLRYWNQEQLLSVAETYHKKGIKLDVIVCDFFHWPRMGDFRFDEEFFPDPEGMVKRLEELGVQLMVSVWPEVAWTSENYEEMKQKGLLVKAEKGIDLAKLFNENSTFTDVTNPQARDYLWEKCRKNYLEKGIRLFWLDEAEPGFTTYDYDNYRCRMGTQAQVGNLYPQLFTRTFYEGLRREGVEKPVNLVRCAWAGSQRYGALVWSGDIHSDWRTFRRQVCAGLNMGIAGIPWWTTDIGGFTGGDPEDAAFRQLLVRWFEWGTFCPVMRLHGDRIPAEMVTGKDGRQHQHTGGPNEIWSFGEENEKILAAYIRLRDAMRPYTRRLMEEAHLYGRPVMRPMFFEFPEQECCWEMKEQYMFGSDMLVAPIMYENAWERQVYLPEGHTWTLLHDGTVYEGGQTVSAEAPLAVIPVFLRDDSQRELIGLI
ncbi:glycoside hydrolase family 31 protein [Eisenbergiella sp.]